MIWTWSYGYAKEELDKESFGWICIRSFYDQIWPYSILRNNVQFEDWKKKKKSYQMIALQKFMKFLKILCVLGT